MKKVSKVIESIEDSIEKLLKKMSKHRFVYYVLVSLFLFALYYLNMKQKIKLANRESKFLLYFAIFGLIAMLVSIVLSYIVNKKKISIYKLFIIISLSLGSLYIAFVPLFSQSDEPAHFLKSYSVAMGRLNYNYKFGNQAYLYPKVVEDSLYFNTNSTKIKEYKTYGDMNRIRKINPKYNEEKYSNVRGSTDYPIFSYFTYAIGMKIGMVLNLNTYYIGMLGRIFNLVICTLLLALGLKLLPYKKNAMIVLLLSPVVIAYNSAYSVDGSLLCYSFLFISYILYLKENKKNIGTKQTIILSVLTILLSITKMAYLPLVASILLLPKDCFKKDTTKKYLFSIFIMMLGILSTMTWLHFSGKDLSSTSSNSNAWIYGYPLRFAYILVNDLFTSGYYYIENIFAGNYLCHGQVAPYEIIAFIYIILFVLSIRNEEGNELRKIEKILIVILIALVYILLALAIYLTNTKYNANLVNGIQGRYFMPFMLLFIILFNKKTNSINKNTFISIAILLNLAVLMTMIVRFMFFV